MASLKELHDLIHKLDKNEKKYLSMMIEGISGKAKSRYANSLRQINAQKVFDADRLKSKLSGDLSGMNLSEANSNLYQFICRSLVSYHNTTSENMEAQKNLLLVEILINKGLDVYKRQTAGQFDGCRSRLHRCACYLLAHEVTKRYISMSGRCSLNVQLFAHGINVHRLLCHCCHSRHPLLKHERKTLVIVLARQQGKRCIGSFQATKRAGSGIPEQHLQARHIKCHNRKPVSYTHLDVYKRQTMA